jgi:hypothetical protein
MHSKWTEHFLGFIFYVGDDYYLAIVSCVVSLADRELRVFSETKKLTNGLFEHMFLESRGTDLARVPTLA